MSKIAVVGCGQMGQAIAYALHKLGHELVLIELGSEQRNIARAKWESVGLDLPKFSARFDKRFFHMGKNDDIKLVVSAAPYQVNWKIAKLAIERGIDYCDLGGNPQISKDIQDYALRRNNARIFTDLGLAPGYINIVAADMVREMPNITDIHLFVGGLPLKPKGRLKYNLVFSEEGLLNEYTGKCRILQAGEIVEVDALTGVEQYNASLEAFHTKGGISQTLHFMKHYTEVKNCSYKTLRYSGHADYVRFLLEDCQMSPGDFFEVMRLACPPTKQDVVHMGIRYRQPNWGNHRTALLIATKHWTAMQLGTSFPAAAVASLMIQKELGGPVLSYEDIKYSECLDALNTIDNTVQWELKDV